MKKNNTNHLKSIIIALILISLLYSLILIFLKDPIELNSTEATTKQTSNIKEDLPDYVHKIMVGECYVDVYDEYAGEPLNMRLGPGKDYPLITTVPDGSDVSLLGFSYNSTDWICVQYNNFRGWVLNKYIFSKDSTTYSSFNYGQYARVSFSTPSHAGLNMRDNPTSTSNKIGTLKEGSIVFIKEAYSESDNGYIAVSYNSTNNTVYVLAKHLTYIGASNA